MPPERRVRRSVSVTVAVLAASMMLPTAAVAQTPLDPANPRSPVYVPPPEATPSPTVGWAAPRDAVVRYERPSSGPVLRPFDAPSSTFGAGHRGVDLGLAPGDPVTAAADGVVHHAGPVAGIVWVSLVHEDGIVTSYGPMADVVVGRGAAVRRGQRLGSLASGGHGHGGNDRGLHFGARRGVDYIDPLSLMEAGTPRPSLVGAGSWSGDAHAVMPYEPWQGDRWAGLATHPSPEADRPGFAVPPSPNHLILLNGFASSSSQTPLDAEHLGYDPRSVTEFSYAGRRAETGDADDPRRDQRPYGPAATWTGVEPAAQRLKQQLRAQRAREPGRAVDLIGHSMGGVVILHYLSNLHDPYDPTLPSIGRVVTIGAPHRGSDVAAASGFLREHAIIGPAIDAVQGLITFADGSTARDRMPPDARAVDQLATGSSFLEKHGRDWARAVDQGAAGPLAMNTQVLAIGGSRDLVVAPGNAHLPIIRNHDLETIRYRGRDPDVAPADRETVLPGGHSSVLRTEAVREAAWRFLAGQETVDAGGGITAMAADQLGPAVHLGSAVAWLQGGFVAGVRRLRSSPGWGPIEPTGALQEHGGSTRPVLRSPEPGSDEAPTTPPG